MSLKFKKEPALKLERKRVVLVSDFRMSPLKYKNLKFEPKSAEAGAGAGAGAGAQEHTQGYLCINGTIGTATHHEIIIL